MQLIELKARIDAALTTGGCCPQPDECPECDCEPGCQCGGCPCCV